MVETPYLSVPYGGTSHGEEEINAVVAALRSSTQMGKHVREMEARVAALFAKQFAVMLNSGSSANYLAIEILDLAKHSEVITPALTFSTTVAPLVKNGLTPVFVDVLPGSYVIDENKVEAAITEKTSALMIPNLLGNLANWPKLHALAKKYNLKTIEDSCDTLGALIAGQSSGVFTDISTTSFYGSHIINCAGNGGMLCVNDKTLSERAKLLRSWGRSSSLFIESEAIENRFNVEIESIPYDAKFIFETIGYNLEPSEIGAAFGLVQLSKLNENIALRNRWFAAHLAFFDTYKEWMILPQQMVDSHTAWLAFPMTVKANAPFTRTELQIFLEKRGIQTRTVFTGNILKQPGFKNIKHRLHGELTHTDDVMKGGILFGCHHGMTENMIHHIHESFLEFIQRFS